jgi:sulfoxide reductase heme-binding subunit YedZ
MTAPTPQSTAAPTAPPKKPYNPSPRVFNLIKGGLFIASLLPFVRLVWAALSDHLGANPVEFITRNTGDWTLIFLCITLLMTPIRRWTNMWWVMRLRRMFGLYVYFYAALHFSTFLGFDHAFDMPEMLKDIVKRPFILVGVLNFILLTPLAITSTDGWFKRMGVKRWNNLHKLVYLIAPLAILHFWWMKAGKHDFQQPIIYGSVLGVLLLLRIYWALFQSAPPKK